jgi:hypothetical protein
MLAPERTLKNKEMENNCLKKGYHFLVDYTQPISDLVRENHFGTNNWCFYA